MIWSAINRLLIITLVLLSLGTGGVAYAIPANITYQAQLTDSVGTPLNGNFDLTFNIYNVVAGGTALWTEAHLNTPVDNGFCSVVLGNSTPLTTLDFDVPYYLGIQVGIDPEMVPRRDLGTVGYAVTAGQAETVADNAIDASKIVDGAVTPSKIGVACPEGDYLIQTATGWDCFSTSCIPQPEICDGIDNDCNGQIDELAPRSCNVSNAFGTCSGVEYCTASGWVGCTAGVPSEEVCDGQDNNCDGQTDEVFFTLGQTCIVGTGECQAIGKNICNQTGDGVECSAIPGPSNPEICDGLDNDCNGSTDDGLAGAPCPNQAGVCAGSTEFCGGTAGWLSCDYTQNPDYEYNEQTCDGIDNDCDGLSDNVDRDGDGHFDQACGGDDCNDTDPVIYPGAFEYCDSKDNDCNAVVDDKDSDGDGAIDSQCTAASGDDCNDSLPNIAPLAAEACDYLDNDCDGEVDEDYKDIGTGNYLSDENCGACGLSCSGSIPNASAYCANNPTPACNVLQCNPGYIKINDAQCIPLATGSCTPCSSSSDCAVPGAECVTLDDGNFCLNPCDAVGGCSVGQTCLDPGIGSNVCVPNTNACNCDGSDTTLISSCSESYLGQYVCQGQRSCTAAGWSACNLPVETCDLLDNNCNGEVDEGFKDLDGRYTSDTNCGSCGNDCTQLTFNGSAGVCNSTVETPTCSLQCDPDFFDLNGDPADGCECNFTSPSDLAGDGIDSNCDGIDGEIGNGIFVSKNGDDANPGTIFLPKLTTQAGIDAAVANGKRDVYVAMGTYNELVLLKSGVGVFGGYSSDFSKHDSTTYTSIIHAPEGIPTAPGAVNCIDIYSGAAGTTVFDGFTVYGFNEKDTSASSYAVYLKNCDETVVISHNIIHGGSGGNGTRGSDGVNGADGSSGSSGYPAFDMYDVYGIDRSGCDISHQPPGGSGGSMVCGSTDVTGGNGGNRVCPAFDDLILTQTNPVVASESGLDGLNNGGTGGVAGRDVWHQAFSCTGYANYGPLEGADGAGGLDGTDGPAGSGCADFNGYVFSGYFYPYPGSNGVSGDHGSGGGGGGSGAGAAVHSSCFSVGYGTDNFGGTGGGGGSGGCAGTAGIGGGSGGGSFAVFSLFESPPVSVPALLYNQIYQETGGNGGDGGAGGFGGAKGAGGNGGSGGGGYSPAESTYPAFKGGDGGDGGRGGNGGGGGGGCGGPSYGIYAYGQGGADLNSWLTNNTFNGGGVGGAGGLGGYSVGNPGTAGANGAVANTNF